MFEPAVVDDLLSAASNGRKAALSKADFLKRAEICWDNINAAFEAIEKDDQESSE